MAEISYILTDGSGSTAINTSTSYQIVSESVMSGFTAGHQYFILAFAFHRNSSNADASALKLVHGASASFSGSEEVYEPAGAAYGKPYMYFTKWTAVSGENVSLHHKQVGGNQSEVANPLMLALDLEDLSTNDWKYNENTTSTQLPNGYTSTNNGEITFTPAEAGDWLVFSSALLEAATGNSSGELFISRQVQTGGGSNQSPSCQREPENNNGGEQMCHTMLRAYSLTAVSNTFTQESGKNAAPTTGDNRVRSAVFALRLGAFRNFDWVYTFDTIDLTASTFGTQIATVGYAPTVTGSSLVIGYQKLNPHKQDVHSWGRFHLDGAPVPYLSTNTNFGGGSAGRTYSNVDQLDGTLMGFTYELDTTSHSVDWDKGFSITPDGTGSGSANRSLAMFTLELASASQAPTAPDAPTNVQVKAGTIPSDTAVQISWTDNSDDEEGFYVHRFTSSFSPTVATRISSLLPTGSGTGSTQTWADTEGTASTTYWYEVEASSSVGVSYSNSNMSSSWAPSPPTGFNVIAFDSESIYFAVTASANAVNNKHRAWYRRSGSSDTFATTMLAAGVPSGTVYDLNGHTTYSFNVTAVLDDETAESSFSTAFYGPTAGTGSLPAAPTGLQVKTGTKPTQIGLILTWNDIATDEDSYYVHRATASFTPSVATRRSTALSAGTEEYTDSGSADTTYWYNIEAINANGSSYNTEVSSTLAPDYPTVTTITGKTTSSVDFSITRAANALDDKHRMYYKVSGSGGGYSTSSLAVGETAGSITGLAASTKYELIPVALLPDETAESTFGSAQYATTNTPGVSGDLYGLSVLTGVSQITF